MAIIAILAMIAIPSSFGRILKEQVNAALPLADIVKEPLGIACKLTKTLPTNNNDAALPEPEKIVSNFISRVELINGAIHKTFGNKAHLKLNNKTLTLHPAVI